MNYYVGDNETPESGSASLAESGMGAGAPAGATAAGPPA